MDVVDKVVRLSRNLSENPLLLRDQVLSLIVHVRGVRYADLRQLLRDRAADVEDHLVAHSYIDTVEDLADLLHRTRMATPPRAPTGSDVAALIPKFEDPDPDIRFMIISDLQKILTTGNGPWLYKDWVTAARAIDCLMKALDDGNGDVQSAALSWFVSSLSLPCHLAELPR